MERKHKNRSRVSTESVAESSFSLCSQQQRQKVRNNSICRRTESSTTLLITTSATLLFLQLLKCNCAEVLFINELIRSQWCHRRTHDFGVWWSRRIRWEEMKGLTPIEDEFTYWSMSLFIFLNPCCIFISKICHVFPQAWKTDYSELVMLCNTNMQMTNDR